MINSIKTTFGFLGSVIEKHTSLRFSGIELEDIYNYVEINESLATSGQPNEQQFHLIQKAGYQVVINLAPKSIIENSLKKESSLLRELGMEYIHIPVKFSDPSESDFRRFSAELHARRDQKVWVHCAANMRVSAFIYRYRAYVLEESDEHIRKDLEKIWDPVGVWKTFIAKV